MTIIITSVWSAFGHRFYSDNGEKCMTCGGVWLLSPDDEPTPGEEFEQGSGFYHARNGDDPTPCTYRTDLSHGETPCEAEMGKGCAKSKKGPCDHLASTHDCNCLVCTG